MQSPLSLFNWSLKETLRKNNDPLLKAKIIVFYFVFLINFIKVAVVFPSFIAERQVNGIMTCVIGLLVTIIVLKILLSRPVHLNKLLHFALFIATCGVWNSLFLHPQGLGLIVVQNVFMICMWSFYGLKGWWGLIYSTVSSIPIIIGIVYHKSAVLALPTAQIPLGSSLAIILLNFIIIFLGHYYYRNILFQTLEAKEKLNDELQTSNAAKTLFFSSMSHELRNPLNTVIGMAALLKEESKEQNENLDILKFSAENLLSLINNILDFNKMGSGKVALEAIPFKLSELLGNTCAGLKIEALKKGLYFKIDIAEGAENLHLLGDPTRLLQIIYNLVGNAIKFTQTGGVTVKVTILKQTGLDFTLRFTIQDTGLGISPEQQQHIFEPFTQASSTTTREFGGTGLGLGIVTQLLNLHGSTIHLESEINAGAKFYFDICYPEAIFQPILQAVSQPQTIDQISMTQQTGLPARNILPVENGLSTDVPEAVTIHQLSAMKVLLAEDNQMNILLMKKLFEKWGIQLTVAADGGETIRLVNESLYDLILMDIHMPVLNGYETTLKIREMENKVKAGTCIIALTGSVSEEAFSMAKAAGMNDLLTKPFQAEELYEKLCKVWLKRLSY